MKFLGLNIFFIGFLLLLGGFTQASEKLVFSKGVLDLRGYNLDELKEIEIIGEWEFYWNQLLESSDFENIDTDSIRYIHVPYIWNSYKINGKKLPVKGAATYRAKIILDTTNCNLAFKLGNISTASNLFVNGELISRAGNVSLNESEAKPGFKTGVVNFVTTSNIVEIIFQISNYHYARSGFWDDYTKIGTSDNINRVWNRKIQFLMLSLGIMFIIAFYNLSLYYLNRNFKYTLYFGLFCIVILTRTLLVDDIFLLTILPDFNWFALVKIEYLTLTLGSIFFVLFINSFYNDKSLKMLVLLRFIVVVSIINSLLVLFTAPIIYTKFIQIYQVVILFALAYTTIIVIRALIKKNSYAIIMLLGFLILMVTVISDILSANRVINVVFLSSFGFVIFIISQAYMMSKHFSSLYVEAKDLTQELKGINAHLEEIVDSRTSKVKEQNHLMQKQQNEILSKNQKLKEHNIEIELQRDNFDKQHRIVNEQKKQITSSIEYASKIQSAVLDSSNEIETVAQDSFVLFKPKDIVSGDFYWFREVIIGNSKLKIVAVVDCTGHGVPGAFMSILGTLLLNKIITELHKKPKASSILNIMRSEVKMLLRQQSRASEVKDGMDMAIVIIDYGSMKIQYAGANNPLFVIRKTDDSYANEIEEYRGDSMPIGIYIKEKDSFTNHVIDIKTDELIYLFTDGFYDQFGGDFGKKFMKKEFKKLLLKNAYLPLEQQKSELEMELKKWQGDYEQIDDITVVGFRI